MDKHVNSLWVKMIFLSGICLILFAVAKFFFNQYFSYALPLMILVFSLFILILELLRRKLKRLETTVAELKSINFNLNKELNKAIFEILALFEFTNILGSEDIESQPMMEMMIDTIKRIIDYDGCALFLYDDSKQIVSVAVNRNFPELQPKMELHQFFAKEVLLSGQAMLIKNILEEPVRLTRVMNQAICGDFRSFIAVPLHIQNKTIGVLSIAKQVVAGFSHEDLRLLFIIGNEAALAIQNKNLYEQVYFSSITDGLTGLYNHKYFREYIRHGLEKARQEKNRISLVLMDIDYFKNINDTYGHLVGDEVLKQVSEILRVSLPEDYLIARYGGEEFAVLMPAISQDSSAKYSEAIRARIEAYPFQTGDGKEFRVTVSLGVACYPDHIVNEARMVEELIDLADENLYRAKHEGRNRVCAF